jgi:hypothetical protein
MNNIVNEIYRLSEKSIVTPSNLIDNLKLEKYKKISYQKTKDNYLKCEMITEENGKKIVFDYYFDDRDFLIYAEAIEGTSKELLFDRSKKLKQLLHKYNANNQSRKAI